MSHPADPGATRGELYMIGNGHIDPVWLWQWPEGYTEVRATFASALDRMAEYPDFVFTCDSVAYLAWVEEHDPELFARIAEKVAEGRFEIAGGWWVEPDCNIPSGESYVRHALYSQRYLRAKFGVTATVGLNVDPFGHNATLPQLLAKAGITRYAFLRPQAHELELPGPLFWWESPDGSRVLAYRIPHEYTGPRADLTGHVQKALAQLPVTSRPLMCFYGVGNHGGGPTRENVDSIHELDRRDLYPPLRLARMDDYFTAAEASGDSDEIPVWRTELQPHAVGCYAAHSGVKRWNRRAENALLAAERWATVARVVAGMPAPTRELEHAWRQVLFNQFHDILAGTSIEPAYDDARDSYGEALAIAARVQNRSLQSITRRIDIPLDPTTSPVVVCNPHPWPVASTVELEFGGFREPAELVDDTGTVVPLQEVRSHAVTAGRRRFAFHGEVDGLGYRLYRLRPRTTPTPPVPPGDTTTLANAYLRAVIDPDTGWLSSLVDLRSGVDLVDASRPHTVVLTDRTDTWGHGVRSFRDVAGTFTPEAVGLVEHGPVRSVIQVRSRYRDSSLVEEFVLAADTPWLDVRVTVEWHERLAALKLRFPTTLADVTATHEVPYGHLVRPASGQEVPSQAWVDVSGVAPTGHSAGLALLNDGKYSFDVTGNDIGMTVLRSPAYAWHDPARLDPDGDHRYLDQGEQRFTYRLVPHAGDWRAAGVVRLAAELNQPLTPLLECFHHGDLPARRGFVDVAGPDAPQIVVTVVKLAEDHADTVVVRAYETAGRPADVTLTLPLLDREIPTRFTAHEVKTLLVPTDPDRPVTETDLLETPPA